MRSLTALAAAAAVSLTAALPVATAAPAEAPLPADTETAAPAVPGDALAYRDVEDLHREARAAGLTDEQEAVAGQLQRIVNGYAGLPEEVRDLPLGSPEVTAAVERIVVSVRQTRELTFKKARWCATGFANALPEALPGANILTAIENAGGATELGRALVDALRATSADEARVILSETAGEQTGGALAETLEAESVAESCSAIAE